MQNKYPNEKNKRFNTPAYKKRMNDARRYKRRQSAVPTEKSVALRRSLKAIPAILILAFLGYLIYYAPFLKVQTLTVNGADSTLQLQIQQAFSAFLVGYEHGIPERNIAFFSKAKFTQIVAADPLVEKVQSVQKRYWHTVAITVIQRVPAYLLQTPATTYVIANDGSVSAVLGLTDPVPQGLPIISDASSDSFQAGSQALPASEVKFVTTIQDNFSKFTQTTAQSYQISSKSSSFLTVLTAAGYKTLFDSTDDPITDLQHLQQVLGQQSKSTHLAYIDLRFNPRVYVCSSSQPCATVPETVVTPSAPSNPSVTSTSQSPSLTPQTPSITTEPIQP